MTIPENSIENMGTRHRFSDGNFEIALLKKLTWKKCCVFKLSKRIKKTQLLKLRIPKKHILLRKNAKHANFGKQHRKRGDASSIFARKFRNRTFEQIDPQNLNLKIAHAKKNTILLIKNSKIEKPENRRQKHRDASTIFSRKSRNRTFHPHFFALFSAKCPGKILTESCLISGTGA